jgi:hypothetical protein
VPIYRLHDTTGDDLGLLEHPAPNLEPGEVVVVADGRETIVTARVEAEPGWGIWSRWVGEPQSVEKLARGRCVAPILLPPGLLLFLLPRGVPATALLGRRLVISGS